MFADPNAGIGIDEALTMEQMFLAFVIWVGTIALSIVVFVCEKLYPNTWILVP